MDAKKILIAGIAAAVLYGAPVFAADRTAPYDWTGCYIGASGGGVLWEKTTLTGGAGGVTINGIPLSVQTEPTGFIGGGQVGCDYQAPSNWLIGIQGDFNGTNARDRKTSLPPLVSETVDTKIDWFASATARLGYAYGPWLIYGKGGAAWVKDKLRDSGFTLFTNFDFSGTSTTNGWTTGAGVEYALAPSWSMSLEYDYYSFGTKKVTLSGLSNGAPSGEAVSLKQNFSVVKLGLNYHFATGR
jgi:outer membrane immunogenic protein